MIQEFLDLASDFYQQYQLELTWLVIAIWVLRSVGTYLRKKHSTEYVRVNKEDALTLPLKPDFHWLLSILSLIFTFIGMFIVIQDIWNDSMTRKSWITLGTVTTLIIYASADSFRKLLLKVESDKIILNDIQYKAAEMLKVELWDDLIFIQSKSGENNIWLRYKAKHYKRHLT